VSEASKGVLLPDTEAARATRGTKIEERILIMEQELLIENREELESVGEMIRIRSEVLTKLSLGGWSTKRKIKGRSTG
jgi:hypothetical protein